MSTAEPYHLQLLPFGFAISPEQLAKDFKKVRMLLSQIRGINNFLVGPDVTQPRLVYYLIGLLFIVYSLLFIVYYLVGNKRWILTPHLQTKQGISMPYPEKYRRFESHVLKWNRVFQCLHLQGENYPFWPNWARVASWFFGFMNLKAKFDLNRGAYTYFYVILMLKTSVNGKSGNNYPYLNLRILNMFSLSSMLNATTNTVDCVVWSSGLFRMMSVTDWCVADLTGIHHQSQLISAQVVETLNTYIHGR